jgi:hypothetical protein
LEEYAPEIIYIKGIHNTAEDAILLLEYDPKLNKTNEYTHAMLGVEPEELSVQWWKSFAHHWQCYHETSTPMQAYCFHMNEVFAKCSDKDELYPLITVEIAAAQWADASLKHLFKHNAVIDQGLEIKLIENTTCVCTNRINKIILSLQWLFVISSLLKSSLQSFRMKLQYMHTNTPQSVVFAVSCCGTFIAHSISSIHWTNPYACISYVCFASNPLELEVYPLAFWLCACNSALLDCHSAVNHNTWSSSVPCR